MMPSYTTKADVARFKAGKTAAEQYTMMSAAASRVQKDTFLSHSSKDNDLVPGVVAVLEGHGGKVYVDLGDDRLPEPPSVETATVLRGAIHDTRRFVLLISANSRGSKWVPWELGLADGEKGVPAVALFPVVETATETKWSEQEYFGLYRRIVYGNLNQPDGRVETNIWMVFDHHTNTATKLSDWLRGSN